MGISLSIFTIYSLFFLINIGILWNDILYRKIPNILLGFLLILLPIWLYILPGDIDQLSILLGISGGCLLGGVFFSQNDKFLGAGDIKYISILILFLGPYSFPILVGNIGFLTICILLFWWIILLIYCYILRGSIGIKEKEILFPTIKINTLYKNILLLIFDWIIIGFFLSLVIKGLSIQMFNIVSSNGDFYFILSLLIFLVRPNIRYILIKWKHRIFPIAAILLFFGIYIQENGLESLLQEIYGFITNIWKFTLGFIIIQNISSRTFLLYDSLIEKSKAKNIFRTIPYSVIIFGGFISLNFLNINFISIIKTI